MPRAQELPCLLHEEDAGSLPSFLPADKLPIDASPLRTVPDRMDEAFFVLTHRREGGRLPQRVRLIEAGYSNKDIADALCLSTNTVCKHIESIYAKTGTGNRLQLLHKLGM